MCNLQEVKDLQEQLRDVMFYLEAQQKLAGGEGLGGMSREELQESQVIVGAAASSASSPQGAGLGGSGKKLRRKAQRWGPGLRSNGFLFKETDKFQLFCDLTG